MEDKLYLSLAECVEFVGVPASTLRYWEKHFPELSPERRGKRRVFPMALAQRLKRLQALSDAGIALAKAVPMSNDEQSLSNTLLELRTFLEGLRKAID